MTEIENQLEAAGVARGSWGLSMLTIGCHKVRDYVATAGWARHQKGIHLDAGDWTTLPPGNARCFMHILTKELVLRGCQVRLLNFSTLMDTVSEHAGTKLLDCWLMEYGHLSIVGGDFGVTEDAWPYSTRDTSRLRDFIHLFQDGGGVIHWSSLGPVINSLSHSILDWTYRVSADDFTNNEEVLYPMGTYRLWERT